MLFLKFDAIRQIEMTTETEILQFLHYNPLCKRIFIDQFLFAVKTYF